MKGKKESAEARGGDKALKGEREKEQFLIRG